MSSDEEKKGRRAGLPASALEEARRLLVEGNVQGGLRALGGLGRSMPDDLPAWLEVLVPACRMVGFYNREDIGRRLVQRTRERFSMRRSDARWADAFQELQILELRLEFSEKGVLRTAARIEKALSRVRHWKPWMVELRSLVLLNQVRLDDLDRFLRSLPCRLSPGSVEYASRLEHLAMSCVFRRRCAQAKTILSSALRNVPSYPSLESAYLRVLILLWMIRAHEDDGSEVCELLREVEKLQKRFRFARLSLVEAKLRFQVLHQQGRYEEAIRARQAICLRGRPRTVFAKSHWVVALHDCARGSLHLGEVDKAEKFIARAGRIIHECPYPVLMGTREVLRAMVMLHRGALGRARILFDRAEAWFHKVGSDANWWDQQICIGRAALYMKEGKVNEVLEQVALADQKDSPDRTIHEYGLLLKSHLLLNKDAPRPRIYEEVLRSLGLVKDPLQLFKILANLYIYSWELEDQLELTDLHLKQLEKLRAHLAPALYERLYRTHVTERVFRRYLRRQAGGPDADGGDGRELSAAVL